MRGKRSNVVYMLVTEDEYELPLMVVESLDELANATGIKKGSVAGAISKSRRYKTRCKYVRVELEEGE